MKEHRSASNLGPKPGRAAPGGTAGGPGRRRIIGIAALLLAGGLCAAGAALYASRQRPAGSGPPGSSSPGEEAAGTLEGSAGGARPPGGAAGARPSIVILVSIDTLRADHLGSYGYQRPTSPALDGLASEGTQFEDASSPAPWTLPAHASLLTGVYPARHGMKSHECFLPEVLPTLASLFAKAGWTTAAVVNSNNLSRRYGLDRGFQEFVYVQEDVKQREPSKRIVDQAIAWLRQFGDRKLFLFVHGYDVHSDYASLPLYERAFVTPYDGPADGTTRQLFGFRRGRVPLGPRDAAHLIELYDAGIRQMDDEVGRLVAFLRSSGIQQRALVVVVSDHGEEFLEHGGVLHGATQFQEVMHVPLIFRGPGIPAGKRVVEPVSLLDVMPTLLHMTGIEADAGTPLDGRDLAPLWAGGLQSSGDRDRYLFGEADHANAELDITRAARHGSMKLILDRATGAVALFDLASDPGERIDLAAGRPAVVSEMRARLDRFMEIKPVASTPLQPLTPEEIERLRSLGYAR